MRCQFPLPFDFVWGLTDEICSCRMLKDDRVRGHQERSIFNFKDISDRLG